MTERPLTPDDERHGKYTTYSNYRCPCEPCRAAWNAYNRAARERRAAIAAELRAAEGAA